MKSLAFFVLLFFAVPGSGQMIWDGIPFSTRAEFATLVILVVTFLSRSFRDDIRNRLEALHWSVAIKPALLILCLLKVLTFAWSPMKSGFESCYRSLYNPLPKPTECERSYESPFLRAEQSQFLNASRIDAQVDFGKQQYDWSLPFMNDYPRLGNLWLNRFPFEATYSARLNGVSTADAFIPVWAVGGLSVTVNDTLVVEETNYDEPYLSFVEAPTQPFDLEVRFRYTDDDRSEIPDSAPPPRGPYAQLKIGQPQSLTSILGNSTVRVTGIKSFAGESSRIVKVLVRDQAGSIVLELAGPQLDQQMRSSDPAGIQVNIAAKYLLQGPLEIGIETADARFSISRLSLDTSSSHLLTITDGYLADRTTPINAALVAERDSIVVLRPGVQSPTNDLFRVALLILDLTALFLSALMLLVIVQRMRRALIGSTALAIFAWLCVYVLDGLLPAFVGGGRELVIPYALLAVAIAFAWKQVLSYPLGFMTAPAGVLAVQKVFDHLKFNHPGEGDQWWGKLLFFWRDSDWFVARGNGRTILLTGSLQGGEDSFWLQIGSRYLAFVNNFVFGENDILIGLIFVTLGFIAVSFFAARLFERLNSQFRGPLTVFVLFICLILLGDQIIVAFGFLVSSEFPTWVVMLAIAGHLLRPGPETRVWVTTVQAAVIGLLVHFRPNLLFVSIVLLLLILTKLSTHNSRIRLIQTAWAIAVYVCVIPLSLLHNLYYGRTLVPFTGNASINYAFDLKDTVSSKGVGGLIDTLWDQLRSLMYWGIPHDANFAIFFWGAQLVFILVIFGRLRQGGLSRKSVLPLLLPTSYIIPMLRFEYSSYYPRHLVSASLLCLVSAALICSHDKERDHSHL